jgi:citrate synthase
MDVLRSAASLLAHWEPEVNDNSHAANVRKTERLIAKMPVIVAARQRLKEGKEVIAADPKLPLPANFLWMLRGEKPSARQVKALDVSLILYAEHEFNASAFAARCVVSTLSDLHSAITAAIGALKGPLHGPVPTNGRWKCCRKWAPRAGAEAWIRNALANKRRIMGFGHRVYKDGDPRAVFLKTLTVEVAKETGHEELEQTAEIIETIVRNEKKLPPNVDWPCARLYHYLGLPIDLYTPLFVVARVVGWSAHVIEQLDNNRLIRPRAIYNGVAERKWKAIGER